MSSKGSDADISVDIAVVGGGMVGAAAAVGMQQMGLSVALLESQPPAAFDSQSSDFDLRVVAVSPASVDLLKQLSAWEQLPFHRIQAYEGMRVWESGGQSAELSFDAEVLGVSELGHIIENSALQSALWKAFSTEECGSQLVTASVVDMSGQAEAGQPLRLTLSNGQHLTANWVIAADGANSSLRRAAKISCHGYSYGQRGLVAQLKTEKSHQRTAWQRFLPGGPVAMLPLSNGHSSLVWSLPEAHAAELEKNDPQAFCVELEAALEGRLGQLELVGPRRSFPLKLQQADELVKDRLILLGDAAQVIHPLAGQGVNVGLAGVEDLLQIFAEARRAGRQGPSERALLRYQRQRKQSLERMVTMTDGLNHLFRADDNGIGLVRRGGLRLVNSLDGLKRYFVSQATGQTISPKVS